VLNNSWTNPWKLTTIGLALVGATALVTGLVVANRSGSDSDKGAAVTAAPASSAPSSTAPASSAPRTTVSQAQTPQAAPAASGGVPSQSAIASCNQAAASQTGHRDKTVDTVKDAGIGAIAGAALGAAGGAIAGGGKGAGRGAAIGGLVGAGGGTLYGLNENKQHDERYRDAYAACMRSHGYTG
jgi:cytoskeletal protein RodZ